MQRDEQTYTSSSLARNGMDVDERSMQFDKLSCGYRIIVAIVIARTKHVHCL
jgi:hypothetical protein